MSLSTFLIHYWWLAALILIVLFAIIYIEVSDTNRSKRSLTCDESILKVNDHGFILVDIRPIEQFKSGAIMGAIHLSALPKKKSNAKKTKSYIFYCQDGEKSYTLADKENHHYLKGGYNAWLSQNLPIHKED